MQTGLQKRGTLFFIIVLILTMSGLANIYLTDRYQEARTQSAYFQLEIFRSGMVLVQDVAHLRSVLARVSASTEQLEALRSATEQGWTNSRAGNGENLATRVGRLEADLERDEFALTEALDFLFVRGASYIGYLEKEPELIEELVISRALVDDLVGLIDRELASSIPDWPELLTRSQPIMTDLSAQVLAFGELQYQVQSRAVVDQERALDLLMAASMAFLWFFSLVAIATVFVLRSEVVARFKRQEAEEKAQFLAYYDALTGLPNRARFADAAARLLKENPASTVLLFDLDDFKAVNDLYGHAAGDALLMRVAEVLEDVIGSQSGISARLGGDEFAAILPGPLSSIKIASVCERLISEVRSPFFHETVQLSGKISIGIAQKASEAEFGDLSVLQKAADTALYRAKSAGKNTYAFYDRELAEMAERRRDIEAAITEALRTGDGFSLVLQPQVAMKDEAIYGFESLMRFAIDGVAISPFEFISIAEATGQVVELDLWGLKTAAHTFAKWHADGLTDARLSCNLSSLHFKSSDIVKQVSKILEETGLSPERLTLEITESMLLEDIEKVTAILERLRQLGVMIALDDFGTGYSSLSYLRKLSVDIIKIDQSFVRGLQEGSDMRVILEAIVDIAHGLGKSLVVEGIETEDEARIIRDLNCGIGQGYLFGRPMGVEDAQARLAAPKSATG